MSQAFIVGVDEAGRGPLAGDVFAAAVVLNPLTPIAGLADSKKLSQGKRELLRERILESSLAYGISSASHLEIDSINILQATMLAMRRATAQCIDMLLERCKINEPAIMCIKIDGNRDPHISLALKAPALLVFSLRTQCIVKGDVTVAQISAASILAKTERDASMQALHLRYPEYGFNQHKGYGTAMHMKRLQEFGAIPEHRRSFSPVSDTQSRQIC
jgi:ribonuclease HII